MKSCKGVDSANMISLQIRIAFRQCAFCIWDIGIHISHALSKICQMNEIISSVLEIAMVRYMVFQNLIVLPVFY